MQIHDVWGPSPQGEGRNSGQLCFWVRLYGCHLRCVFCDTPETWVSTLKKSKDHLEHKIYPEIENSKDLEVAQVVFKLEKLGCFGRNKPRVVITGGEPLLQREFENLCIALKDRHRGLRIEVETSGTICPSFTSVQFVDKWNVSPKLENSGNHLHSRLKKKVLREFVMQISPEPIDFKFVCSGVEDLEEVKSIVDNRDIVIPHENVWIMPEGITSDQILETAKKLLPEVMKLGYNLTLREHILVGAK